MAFKRCEIVFGVMLACAPACSSSNRSGSLPFNVQDQVYFGGDEIKLLDYSAGCSLQQADDSHVEGSEYIELDFTEPISEGSYSVGDSLSIQLHQRDESCNLITDAVATTGTVAITSVTSSGVQGSFTAYIPGYGTIANPISAAFCDVSRITGSTQCLAEGVLPSGSTGGN